MIHMYKLLSPFMFLTALQLTFSSKFNVMVHLISMSAQCAKLSDTIILSNLLYQYLDQNCSWHCKIRKPTGNSCAISKSTHCFVCIAKLQAEQTVPNPSLCRYEGNIKHTHTQKKTLPLFYTSLCAIFGYKDSCCRCQFLPFRNKSLRCWHRLADIIP